jgi:hypothetical protein
MAWWAWTLIGVYLFGFVVCLVGHLMFLQMVMPPLALLRSFVWPIFLVTGWPHGVPEPMD